MRCKVKGFLLCCFLALFLSPFCSFVFAQSENLQGIDDFDLIFGDYPQYAYYDEDVTLGGEHSIRVEPDYVGDTREVDSYYFYPVNVGDRIVYGGYIKTSVSAIGDTVNYHGGRYGFDLYANTSEGFGIVDSYPHDGQEHIDSVVVWNTSQWTYRGFNVTIPSTYYTRMHTGNMVFVDCEPVQASYIICWFDVRLTMDGGFGWFANTSLVIDYYGDVPVSPSPSPTAAPTVTPTFVGEDLSAGLFDEGLVTFVMCLMYVVVPAVLLLVSFPKVGVAGFMLVIVGCSVVGVVFFGLPFYFLVFAGLGVVILFFSIVRRG